MQLTHDASPVRLDQALKADHVALEATFRRALGALRGGDADVIRAHWLALEKHLTAHLSAEEQLILPGFEQTYPNEAAHIRREHEDIRAQLVQFGIDLDLHALREEAAARFIRALEEHAAREDVIFYRWAQVHLADHDQRSVLERLRAHLAS